MTPDFKTLAQKSKASQDWFELWKLLELVWLIQPHNIVEIGVDRGYSLLAWRQAFGYNEDLDILIGVDTTRDNLGPEVIALGLQDNIIQGDSHNLDIKQQVVDRLGDELIDFLFIDGDHSYEGAMTDFELYASLVRPGGIIAFHDIQRDPARVPHHAGVDCRRVFDELKKRHASIEIWNGTAGDNGPGIGVLFV